MNSRQIGEKREISKDNRAFALPSGSLSLYQPTDAAGLPEYWHFKFIGPAPCWLIGE